MKSKPKSIKNLNISGKSRPWYSKKHKGPVLKEHIDEKTVTQEWIDRITMWVSKRR